MHAHYLKAIAIILAVSHTEAIQIFTKDTLPSETLSSKCVDALVADIACPSQIVAFGSGSEITTEALEEACTASCSDALSKHEVSVRAACTEGDVYDVSETGTAPVSFLPTLLFYEFNKTCVKDGDRWCHAVVYGTSSGNEQVTLGDAKSSFDMCDNCVIKEIKFQAESPLFDGYELQSNYSSLTSSCSKTNFPLATSTIPFSQTDTTSLDIPTPSPSCTGGKYTIKSGDTCRSISKSQSIGTAWLVQDNNLQAFCADFPQSGDLCIMRSCKTYTAKSDDTCKSIARSHRLTQTQVLTWNPILGSNCRNFNQSVGDEICVSPPGNTAWVPPVASVSTSTGPPTSTATAAPVPSNVAEGTTDHCAQYYTVEPGDYCNKLMVKFSISLDDFLFLNTGVNQNCTNLFAEESYCVEPVGSIDEYPGSPGYISPDPSVSDILYSNLPKATYTAPQVTGLPTSLPFAKGTRKDCYAYANGADLNIDITYSTYKSVCEALAFGWGIGLTQLQNWNPSLDTTSNECAPEDGYQYCMEGYKITPTLSTETVSSTQTSSQSAAPTSTELPIRDGTIEDCDKYAAAESGVTCASILEDNDITIAQFYKWNPEVNAECTNFWPNYRYCVKGPEPTQTSTQSTPTATELPIRDGAIEDCEEYVSAGTGVTCASILEDNGITIAQFYQWNPAVNAQCTNFWPNYRYCIKGPESTPTNTGGPPGPTQPGIAKNCNKWHIAKANEDCSTVAKDYGITRNQFLEWNPAVSDDCTAGFWKDEAYCVGVSS